MCGRIVIGVGDYLETGPFKQGTMVFPAWIANGNSGIGRELLDKVCTNLKRTCTT